MLRADPGIGAMILDLVMPDLDGMAVMEAMAREGIAHPGHRPDRQFLARNRGFGHAPGRRRLLRQAGRAGAADHLAAQRAEARSARNRRSAPSAAAARGTLGARRHHHPQPRRWSGCMALCAKAAKSTIPVLIEGETGVGKELIARVIQGMGDRAGKPFVTVNCGAIPANLVEFTLFGHKKGAFTGAIADHAGKFAEAHGGTHLPRRGRRAAARHPGQAPPRPPGGRDRAGRRDQGRAGQCPGDLGHQPAAAQPRQGRRLPRGPLLPAQRLPDLRAAAARAHGGHPARWSTSSSPASPPKPASASSASPRRRWRCSQGYNWPGNIRQLENAVYRAVVLSRRRLSSKPPISRRSSPRPPAAPTRSS